MKRAKYKPKNPNEYKQPRKCHKQDCKCEGIIIYHTVYSCIPHLEKGQS